MFDCEILTTPRLRVALAAGLPGAADELETRGAFANRPLTAIERDAARLFALTEGETT